LQLQPALTSRCWKRRPRQQPLGVTSTSKAAVSRQKQKKQKTETENRKTRLRLRLRRRNDRIELVAVCSNWHCSGLVTQSVPLTHSSSRSLPLSLSLPLSSISSSVYVICEEVNDGNALEIGSDRFGTPSVYKTKALIEFNELHSVDPVPFQNIKYEILNAKRRMRNVRSQREREMQTI